MFRRWRTSQKLVLMAERERYSSGLSRPAPCFTHDQSPRSEINWHVSYVRYEIRYDWSLKRSQQDSYFSEWALVKCDPKMGKDEVTVSGGEYTPNRAQFISFPLERQKTYVHYVTLPTRSDVAPRPDNAYLGGTAVQEFNLSPRSRTTLICFWARPPKGCSSITPFHKRKRSI